MAQLEHLITERLYLREFRRDDFEANHAYGSNPDNIRFMVWGPNTEQDTRNFLEECIRKTEEDPVTQFEYAITLKENKGGGDTDGKMIGGCGIYLNDKRNMGMLGWILHMDYWKQGIAAEAGEALLKFGFEKLNLHRITATCNAENYGSYKVMEKLGMRREACFVQGRYGRVGNEEKWYDEYHYAILKEEWKARQKKQPTE